MAMGLLQALFVSAIPMVLASPLAQTWDRRPESLVPHHEAVLRAGLLLTVPLVVAAAAIGTDLVEIVTAFTPSEAHLMIELFLILSANVLWGLLQSLPYAALLAVGRYVAVAAVTAIVVATQVAIAFIASAADDVHLLAASVPVGAAISAIALCMLVAPQYLWLAAPRLGRVLAVSAGSTALSFGVMWTLRRRCVDLPYLALSFVATALPHTRAPHPRGRAVNVAVVFPLALEPGHLGALTLRSPNERDTARRLLHVIPRRR